MEYTMRDINIYVVNDAVFFGIENKSILDQEKQIPFEDKQRAFISDFVNDNGENTYYCTNFPAGCVDFLTLNKKNLTSPVSKQLLKKYNSFKKARMFDDTQPPALTQFLHFAQHTKISDQQLLDMYQDITNGYIRKKAFIRIAFKLVSEDCDKAISEKMIQAEIYKIEKETADRISKGYKTFEDTPSL